MAKKILVIDDDELVVKTLRRLLVSQGYEADAANSAAEALNKISVSDFDLIISDIRMPGKNGVETAHEVKKLFSEKAKKDIPVVFITGFAEMGDQLKAEQLGEVILKPFDLDRIMMTIRDYL